MTSEKKAFDRLPNNVVPSNYKIRLQPNLTAFTFDGTEEISVQVKTATDTIIVNSVDIAVQEVSFNVKGKTDKVTGTVSFDTDNEKASFKFPVPLPIGEGVLSIKFTGELNDKMKGFYRSNYTSPDGQERHAAVTQFEVAAVTQFCVS